jgi:hypothetical protein
MTDSPISASPASGGGASHAPGGQDESAGLAGINVQLLADKVYDLLLADARLGRARGDSPLIAQRNGEG